MQRTASLARLCLRVASWTLDVDWHADDSWIDIEDGSTGQLTVRQHGRAMLPSPCLVRFSMYALRPYTVSLTSDWRVGLLFWVPDRIGSLILAFALL